MSCTLTAVPYPATTASRVIQHHQNPAARAGTTGWDRVAGTGGTAAAVSTTQYAVPIVGRDGALLPMRTAARHVQTTAATASAGLVGRTVAGSVGGGSIHASMYVAASTPTPMRLVLIFVSAAGAVLSSVEGAAQTVEAASSGWTRLVATAAAPAGVDRVEVWAVTVGAAAPGLTIDGTGLLIANGGVQYPYFDGSTSVPVGGYTAWRGAADASFSDWFRHDPVPGGSIQSTPQLVLDYAAPRESATVAHRPIGRPDPVHALGPLRTREGTLALFYPTHAAASAAQRLHHDPVTGTTRRVMLRDSDDPEMDMYYVPRSVQVEPTSERTATQRWVVTVEYTEVYATGALY